MQETSAREKAISAFEKTFGEPARFVVRAPGRVNLMGDHTDYNEGFVLPMAIDRALYLALRPRQDRMVRVIASDFQTETSFNLDQLHPGKGWQEYLKGAAFVLQNEGLATLGWEGALASDVPIGAGLSSSAAIELAVLKAFSRLAGWGWNGRVMALLAQKIENSWLGLRTGIMDQMISANGAAGQAMLLDCRSLEYTLHPIPTSIAVVVMDTQTRRGLVHSAYNERRAQCDTAAQILGVPALRDASLSQLEGSQAKMDAVLYRRARHVISENERTLLSAQALEENQPAQVGQWMNLSHTSLAEDYEVSSPALNQMVEIARAQTSCFGARMTGAGFGGCAVALVAEDQAIPFKSKVETQFQQKTGQPCAVYVCSASQGVSVEMV